jgi:peptidoglycan/xylan/chitin deacetylase (PgdA/CDA1 family)
LFTTGLRNTLTLLAERRLKATLFVIVEDLVDPEKRDLVMEAARQGHELASHTLTHRRLTTLTEHERREELTESRNRLTEVAGTPVAGFRAPGFALDRATLELVADTGYSWDSSMFAGRRHPPGALGAVSNRPYRPLDGQRFSEIPLPAYDGLPIPFHPSYSLVVGSWHFRRGVRRVRRQSVPLVTLLHLTDLSDPLPGAQLSHWGSRFFTLSFLSSATKRARVSAMLDEVGRWFSWTDTSALLASAPVPEGAVR